MVLYLVLLVVDKIDGLLCSTWLFASLAVDKIDGLLINFLLCYWSLILIYLSLCPEVFLKEPYWLALS